MLPSKPIEIHYQSEEEYERANGVASHTEYKQRHGKENVVFIQQKYLHEEFHRFVDLPIMFEWTSHDDKVRLLDRDETLFTMYPYLRQLQAKKEQKRPSGVFINLISISEYCSY